MKLSVRETETIIKILIPVYCPITKASNNSHFHSSHFIALYFPSLYKWFFLSLLPFLIWLKTIAFRVTIPEGQHQVSSSQQSWALFCGIRTWMGDQKGIPRVVITSFFFIPFRRRYWRLQNSPALCDVVSSISQLFVPHFAMSAFTRIYLQCILNKQRNTSFEFFSILLTFGRLKQ